MTRLQPLASANAPWTRTIAGLGGSARAGDARIRRTMTSRFIGPPRSDVRTSRIHEEFIWRSDVPASYESLRSGYDGRAGSRGFDTLASHLFHSCVWTRGRNDEEDEEGRRLAEDRVTVALDR